MARLSEQLTSLSREVGHREAGRQHDRCINTRHITTKMLANPTRTKDGAAIGRDFKWGRAPWKGGTSAVQTVARKELRHRRIPGFDGRDVVGVDQTASPPLPDFNGAVIRVPMPRIQR